MGFSVTSDTKVIADGRTFTVQTSQTTDGVVKVDKSGANALAAAKSGALTTRTDDNTGTLTMAASHGIATGNRLDVYWSGGSRRGMTVGTVSVNEVPIDGGAGDVLPADETAVTAMVPTQESFVVTGDNVKALACDATARATITFTDNTPTELGVVQITGADLAYFWTSLSGVTNPLAGDSVTRVYLSHDDTTAAREVRATAMYD